MSPLDRCRCAHYLKHHWPDGHRGCFTRDLIGPYVEACPCGKFQPRDVDPAEQVAGAEQQTPSELDGEF